MYWTDVTQRGCFGQFSACLRKNKELEQHISIQSKKGEGSCVAVNSNLQTFRATNCKIRFNLACQAKKTITAVLKVL